MISTSKTVGTERQRKKARPSAGERTDGLGFAGGGGGGGDPQDLGSNPQGTWHSIARQRCTASKG